MEEQQTINENNSNQLDVQERITRGETFAKHYCTSVNLFHTEYDFRLDILNEQIESLAPNILGKMVKIREKISESQIILQPHAAKILFEELKGAIQSYEEHFGQIEDKRPRA